MISSYKKNNFGEIFFSIVIAHKPKVCVELGILYGYSTYHLARALKYNKKAVNSIGHLDAYDLFDDYSYKHGNKEDIEQFIRDKGIVEFVTIYKDDAYKVYKKYSDNSIDLLHVDISNTGETVKKIMEFWDSKIVHKGIILFEGGSEERDNVLWMKKYKMPSIKKELETNEIINANYAYSIYQKFPSLTVLIKKS